MKRALIAFIIPLLLFSLVFAAEETTSDKITELKESVKNNPIDKEITIPENLELVTKILFGIETTLKVSLWIILICIWIIMFLVLVEILSLTPFFHGWTSWVAAIIINIIFGISGTYRSIAIFFFDAGSAIKFLGNWPIITLIVVILILILGAFIVIKTVKVLKRSSEIENAKMKGAKVGAELGFLSKMREMMGYTKE